MAVVNGTAGNDVINHFFVDLDGDSVSNSADTVFGGAGVDNIFGLGDADILFGEPGNDVLRGGNGNDTLFGGLDNDILLGEAGADVLNGGAGNDFANYGSSPVGVDVNLANGLGAFGDAAGDTLTNIENVNGSGFGDFLIGNASANVLLGLAGDDLIDGGGGADDINGGTGSDTAVYGSSAVGVILNLLAGTGAGDTLTSIENVSGSGFADVLVGNTAANSLFGFGGNDRLNGGAGADVLVGGADNDAYVIDNPGDIADEASLGNGLDTVESSVDFSLADPLHAKGSIENLKLIGGAAIDGTGNALNNVITGNGAANVLNGREGNDSLDGGLGLDTLIGGLGIDTFVLANGNDTVNDIGGIDTITSTITRSLVAYPTIEKLTLLGTGAINGTGNGLNNTLTGNAAANILAGGLGLDTLIGGLGNDVLIGGVGKDTMTGSGNGDRFDFNALAESVVGANRDVITDFVRAQGDKIDLSTIDADTDGTAGNQAFSFIGTAAFTGIDGQLRAAGGLVQGDVNGDKVIDFEIQVNGLASMLASDFIL